MSRIADQLLDTVLLLDGQVDEQVGQIVVGILSGTWRLTLDGSGEWGVIVSELPRAWRRAIQRSRVPSGCGSRHARGPGRREMVNVQERLPLVLPVCPTCGEIEAVVITCVGRFSFCQSSQCSNDQMRKTDTDQARLGTAGSGAVRRGTAWHGEAGKA